MLIRQLTKSHFLIASLCLLVGISALAQNRRWFSKVAAGLTAPTPAVAALQANPKEPPKIVIELVTLRATGFDPATITRPKGPFMLAIENRSGVEVVNFQLDKDVGKKLKPVTPKKSDWADVLDPTPGTYVLTETTRPNWSLTLIITPPNK